VIGIDVGVSMISAGVVDPRTGVVIARRREATPSGEFEVLRACVAIAGQLASRHPVGSIGLAVPEIVDSEGVVQSGATWDWRSPDVRLAFADIAPTLVHSDVRAAAFGEAQAGAAQALDCFVYVTVAAGISAVVVRNGRPWEGQCLVAPGVRVPPVELVSSGTELVGHGGPELIAVAQRLGEEIGRVVNLVDPDAVVVGGALGLDPRCRRQWVDVMRQSEWHRPASFVPVIEAQFKTDAELVGAALASGSLVAA
jgi:predicted NBD/HSP70 family sugar kinase